MMMIHNDVYSREEYELENSFSILIFIKLIAYYTPVVFVMRSLAGN